MRVAKIADSGAASHDKKALRRRAHNGATGKVATDCGKWRVCSDVNVEFGIKQIPSVIDNDADFGKAPERYKECAVGRR